MDPDLFLFSSHLFLLPFLPLYMVSLPIVSSSLFKNNFTYLFIFGCAGSSLLCWLSLVAASGGHSLVVVCGLLSAVAFIVAEHGLQGSRVPGL